MDSNKVLILLVGVLSYCNCEAMMTVKPKLPSPFLTKSLIEEILYQQKESYLNLLSRDIMNFYILPFTLHSIEADRAAHTVQDENYEQLISSLNSPTIARSEKLQRCIKYKESGSLDKEKTPYNFTLLSSMIVAENLDVAEMLLKLNANVNQSDSWSYSPLMIASAINSAAAVQLLLKFNLKIDQVRWNDTTALWIAANMGHCEIIRILLNAEANPNPRDNCTHETALYAAASENHVEVVQQLLDAKVDPDIPDEGGYTPLTIAARNGYLEIVALLLSKNADPNKIATNGFTPLVCASSHGHFDVVALLLRHNANPNPPAELSPLDLALCHNHKEIALLLEAHGGKRNKR